MKIKIKCDRATLEKSMMCRSNAYAYENCWIALAVRDLFPNAYVTRVNIYPLGEPDEFIWLPGEAMQMIIRFDELIDSPHKRLALPEFSFEIDVPSEVIEKIGLNEVYKILSESKTLEHVVEEIPVEKLA